jgi:hypothetical protein
MEQPFVRVEAFNVERVAAMFEASPRIMAEELLAAMTEVDLHLQREVADRTPTAYGTLRDSIFSEERIQGDGVLGVVASPLTYAEYVEVGTKPHFPPLEPLRDWVRVKFGLTDETEIRGAAFRVARAISIRGTLGVGMFNRAFAANKAQVERRFEMAVDRTARRMDALREGAG